MGSPSTTGKSSTEIEPASLWCSRSTAPSAARAATIRPRSATSPLPSSLAVTLSSRTLTVSTWMYRCWSRICGITRTSGVTQVGAGNWPEPVGPALIRLRRGRPRPKTPMVICHRPSRH